MFIFKQKRRKGGVTVEATNWTVRFRDPLTRKLATFPGYADEDATKQLGARLYKEACRHAEGLGPPAAARKGGESLIELRAAFRQATLDAGRTAYHADKTDQRIASIVAGCRWELVRDLDADAARRWLAQRRADRAKFGIVTSNHYARALKMFGRWVSRRMKTADPFAGLQLLNPETDRRRRRRALGPDELNSLLRVTRASRQAFRGLSGPVRSALYRVAAFTGLRAGELSRLMASDLRLTHSPAVRISAAQKNRRETWLPLHKSLVPILKRHTGQLWPGTWHEKAAKMLAADLAAAGIPYETATGVVDFHALRSCFGTLLARAGVPLVAAQKLMRHSTPVLTSNVYTSLGMEDLAGELAKLHTHAHTRNDQLKPARSGQARGKQPKKLGKK